MDSYLANLYQTIESRLGALGGLIPTIASTVKIALVEGDVEKITTRTAELREATAALDNLAGVLDAAVADGQVSLAEGAEAALALEAAVDQIEDIIRGYDEDDA